MRAGVPIERIGASQHSSRGFSLAYLHNIPLLFSVKYEKRLSVKKSLLLSK